jgi:hypothetical protein
MAEETPQQRLARLRRIQELRAKAGIPFESVPKPEKPSFWNKALGALEVPLSFGADVVSGIPNMAVGGLAAAGDAALRTASGYGNPLERSAELVEKGTGNIGAKIPTFTPTTESGQQMRGYVDSVLNWVFEKPELLAKFAQDKATELSMKESEITGEPYKRPGALAPTAIQMLPDIVGAAVGMGGTKAVLAKRASDVAGVRRQAIGSGFDLAADAATQAQQLTNRGNLLAGTGMEGIEAIPGQVSKARKTESQRIAEIFREGREGGATVPTSTIGKIGDKARETLKGITYSDLPTVANALEKIDALKLPASGNLTEIMGRRGAAQTAINDIMELRKSINADLPSDIASREYSALSKVKRELDGYLQEAFESDMINGSPASLKRWKEGFKEWNEFKTLFDDDRTIRKMWQEDLNAEQVKRLIFNKNAVNPGADSGTLVKSMKQILGPDHPSIEILQMTVLDDLMLPLTQRTPNYRKFSEGWDKFKRDNGTLIGELYPDPVIKEMDSLADFSSSTAKDLASAAKKAEARTDMVGRVLSVYTVGNELAKSALKIAFGKKLTSALLEPNRENVVISRVLGYNPRKPLIPTSPLQTLSALETARGEE